MTGGDINKLVKISVNGIHPEGDLETSSTAVIVTRLFQKLHPNSRGGGFVEIAHHLRHCYCFSGYYRDKRAIVTTSRNPS
jgi:hypothetical protein